MGQRKRSEHGTKRIFSMAGAKRYSNRHRLRRLDWNWRCGHFPNRHNIFQRFCFNSKAILFFANNLRRCGAKARQQLNPNNAILYHLGLIGLKNYLCFEKSINFLNFAIDEQK